MFGLSARKIALVAAVGLTGALSIGAIAAHASTSESAPGDSPSKTLTSTPTGLIDGTAPGGVSDDAAATDQPAASTPTEGTTESPGSTGPADPAADGNTGRADAEHASDTGLEHRADRADDGGNNAHSGAEHASSHAAAGRSSSDD